MTPQPLTAPYRVTFKYTASGLPHVLHAFCDAFPSADPSGWSIRGQNTPTDTGFSVIDVATYTVLNPFYNPARDSFQGCQLDRNVSGAWVFVAAFATAFIPTGTFATATPSMGLCISGKDGGNRRLPYYIYEGAFTTVQKLDNYAALTAANKALVDNFYNVGGAAPTDSIWNWALSRDGSELPDRWLATVIDSNQKLRRLRHIT